ncbi:TRAP transporter substrate-binding protein [Methylobacterium sp. ID0610]|uniref:TRAP transporter substrate-binding protein n=1 Tax=Methylobacterium carpenticola TaxID=3344827 RepID=UPI0036C14A1D
MIQARPTRRAVALGLGSLGAGLALRPAAAAPVTLRLSSSLPADPNSAHWLWYDRFAASLKAKAGDAVQVRYFPDNQLGKESDVVGSVKLGVVDMMISGSSIWSTLAPEIGVLDLGYVFPTMDSAGRVLDGPAGAQLGRLFADRIGVKVLSWGYSLGARNVTARDSAESPAALRGKKIRVLPVANFVATLRAMGASPTPMSLGEVYTALQTGVIDGLEHDAPTILALKAYEVARHVSLTQHICNPQTIVIGNRAFNKIPAEHRDAVLAAAAEATEFQRSQAATIEAKALATLKANGVGVHECDRAAFRTLVTPLWDEFVKAYPVTKPILSAITQA